jgi:hypothetical protein
MVDIQSISNLEKQLGYKDRLDELEKKFDQFSLNYKPGQDYLVMLRRIKLFLGKRKRFRYNLLEGTKLRGSDCLTMAVLAATIANRKGYDVKIAKPDKLTKYCGAVLYYGDDGEKRIFKVTGRDYKIGYVPLNNKSIMRRLTFTKPLVDFINKYIRRVY